jgi:hypothetical protein
MRIERVINHLYYYTGAGRLPATERTDNSKQMYSTTYMKLLHVVGVENTFLAVQYY